jgi:hypothetical protein
MPMAPVNGHALNRSGHAHISAIGKRRNIGLHFHALHALSRLLLDEGAHL